MKTNVTTRVLSLFLATVLFLMSAPLNVIAQEINALAEEERPNDEEIVQENPTPVIDGADDEEGEEGDEEGGPSNIVENKPSGETYYTEDGLALKLNADGASFTVVGFINPAAKVIRIPEEFNGKPITRIGDSAFRDKSALEYVELTENIAYVGDDVFGGCSSLEFTVYDNAKYLGTANNPYFYLFSSTGTDIASCEIHADTKIIASYAFYNCKSLTAITIPKTVKQVGFRSLRGCDNLINVTLPFAGEVGEGETNAHVGFAFGARTYGGNISFMPESLKSLDILGGTLQQNAFYGLDRVEHLGLPSMQYPLGYYYGGSESYTDNINYVPASLISVRVENGEIPDYAFYQCVNLQEVTIGNGVTAIGGYAFQNCSSLKSVTIGNGVTAIGKDAFGKDAFTGCVKLNAVYINDIGNWVNIEFENTNANPLYYAKNLYLNGTLVTQANIPDSVTSIGSYAFYNCSNLTSITIPDSLTSIGQSAFCNCNKLNAVYISDIGNWVNIEFENTDANPLYYAKRLYLNGTLVTQVNIPNSVTSIGSYAFYNCSNLTSITIPDSVTSIGQNAFYGCSSLTSITIPDSVTSIGQNAFYGCSSLTSITIPFVGATKDGTIDTRFSYIFGSVPVSLKTVTITGGSSIGDQAFSGCSSLTSITIPDSVTSIGQSAFYGCSSLTSITIPFVGATKDGTIDTRFSYIFGSVPASLKTVTITGGSSIGNYAFYGCSSLSSIMIPESVTSIGDYAFYDCNALKTITIPDNVTSIGYSVFNNTAYFKDANNWIDGVLYIGNHLIKVKTTIGGTFVIKESTICIAGGAFSGCSTLTNITMPDSMTSIGNYTFYGCSALTSITIPNSVTLIGNYAFYGCSALTSITMSDNVTSIGDSAFYQCSSLASIMIPNCVISIGDDAFVYCSKLNAVYIDDLEAWVNIDFKSDWANPLRYAKNLYLNGKLVTHANIPEGVTLIGNYAFYRSSITSLTIPDSVISIGISAFEGCSNLESITIPDGVISIGYRAFSLCGSLTSITIPDSMTSIGSYAFYDCSRFTSINYAGSVFNWNKITKDNYWDQYTGNYVIYCSDGSITKSGTITYYTETGEQTAALLAENASAMTSMQTASIRQYTRGNPATQNISYVSNTASTNATFSEGLKFVSNGDGTCYVSGIGTCKDTDIVIPSTSPAGDIVTSIGDQAFYGEGDLTSITISDSVTSIGSYVFYNCSSLTSITIPDSVTSIGSWAFYNCSSLTSITIPDSVTSIGERAFSGCSSLASITIPDSVTSIGDYAFFHCRRLTSITIPDSVTSIGSSAFKNCRGLTSITIPDSVTSIGNSAFDNTEYYNDNSNWIDKILYIGNHLIEARTSLSGALVVRESTICIADHAFYGEGDLTSITIPDSVTSIGERAFSGCSSLASITIPDSVTSIGDDAFYLCSSLTSITIPFVGATKDGTIDTRFHYIFGSVPASLKTVTITGGSSIGDQAFSGCGSLTSITIPDSVTSIGSSAFSSCSSLTSITIPDSVTSIGSLAFYNCSSLTSITIPDSVTSIGSSAFEDCSSLTSITIPDSVTWVSSYAFYNCSSLTSITIPDSVTSIGNYMFYGCYGLTSITIPDSVTSIGERAFSGCSSLASITMPDSVTSIGDYAFYYCSNLTGITIPNGVTSIGSDAFSRCSSLMSITIPDSVTSIGSDAFSRCSSLMSITIPDSVTSIGSDAFSRCSSLTSITIPSNVVTVYARAFEACSSLTTVTFEEGTKIGSIGSKAFNCSNLSVINYPGEENEWRFIQKTTDWDGGRTGYVINFGESKGILYEMSDDRGEFWVGEFVGTLADVEIPEYYSGRPVTKIYDKSFYNTETLKSVIVPDTVNHIDANAFYNCSGLKTLLILGDDVTIEKGMISNCNALVTLQIPCLVDASEDDTSLSYIGYFFGADSYKEHGDVVPKSLSKVIVKNSEKIPAYAFANCLGLETVGLPETLVAIGDNAFDGCITLAEFTVPPAVTSIGDNAFANCALLTEFIIPDSVTSIGITILNNCSGVRSITIGAGITEIPDTAVGTPLFGLNKATSSLESYIISPENKTFVTDGYGVLYETMKISDSEYIEVAVLDAPAKSNLKDYTLPEHIVYIAPYAFAYNTTLRWIQLDRVRRIDNHAFLACTSLVGAIFGQKPEEYVGEPEEEDPKYTSSFTDYITRAKERTKNVLAKLKHDLETQQIFAHSDIMEQYSQFVGDFAFSGCTMLQYVNLYSDFIVAIGEEAFYDCNALTSVHLNKSLERIGLRAFGKTSLEGITVHAENPHFKSIDKVLYEKKDDGSYTLLLYPTHKIAVGVSAFTEANGKKYQTAFAVPAVDDNGNRVHISAIESYAFQEAEWLNDVTLNPWGEMIVGDYAFLNAKIETVRIGANVLSLGLKRGEGEYTVFSDCEDLSSIEVDGGNPYYSSKGGVLFDKKCTKLIKYPVDKPGTTYTMPDTVSTVASMAFKGNGQLSAIAIPSYVHTVGLEAFYHCSNLSLIFFDGVYAPTSIMENAFTTSVSVGDVLHDPRTQIGYSAEYYEDGENGEYGWKHYADVYNLKETEKLPTETPKAGNGYYAVVVVNSSGTRLGNTLVTLTDPEGKTETIRTSSDGIATFYDLFGAENVGFAIDFTRPYTLTVSDENEEYFTYQTTNLYLDGDMRISYVTLTSAPYAYGVSCNDMDINTETAGINKAEFGKIYDEIRLKDPSKGYVEGNLEFIGERSETIEISVIGYYDTGWTADLNGCMLYQNGIAIPGCVILDEKTIVAENSATVFFEVPVDVLQPEVEIEARFTAKDGNYSADCAVFLNIDVIDFSLSAEDVHLDTEELSVDLSAGGDILSTLFGSDTLNFKLGNGKPISIVVDGKTITVSLNAERTGSKNSSVGEPTSDFKSGYQNNHDPHNKDTWYFSYRETLYDEKGEPHTYKFNVRFARGTEKLNYYYYQCSVYQMNKVKPVLQFYGRVNSESGRAGLAGKSSIIVYTYLHEAQKYDDISMGTAYFEEIKKEDNSSVNQTKNSFNASLYGEVVFQYEEGKLPQPVSGQIKGTLSYSFEHNRQMVIWIIPITLNISVDVKGEVFLSLEFDDDRKLSVQDARMTVSAEIGANVGVGCEILSAGVSGMVGTVFILEFYPEFGIDSWNIYGSLSAYVTYATIEWKKGWLGIPYPSFGSETKEYVIYEGNKYIIGEDPAKRIAYVPLSAIYLADAYGGAEPENYRENATVFVSGTDVYKIGFVNMSESNGYDQYNYLKLALTKWDKGSASWGESIVLDDNGYNDFHYTLYDGEDGIMLVYTQQTEKTNAETTENTYDYVSDLAVKVIHIKGMMVDSTPQLVADGKNFKYLATGGMIDSVPTVVWAENSDNNMFGVSPKNYVDEGGQIHVFETNANSIWMSRYINGTWTKAECLADGLSTVMDITVTADGHIAYILDMNANLSDAHDRVMYYFADGMDMPVAFNDPTEKSVLKIDAQDNGIVYYYQSNKADDSNVSGVLYLDFDETSADAEEFPLPEITENVSGEYTVVLDQNSDPIAILYVQNKVWTDAANDRVSGAALYGIFRNGDEWGNPIEIETDMICAEDGVCISSFDAVMDPNNRDALILNVEYVNGDGGRAYMITDLFTLASDVSVDSSSINYTDRTLTVTVTNRGAIATEVVASISGGNKNSLGVLASGETATYQISLLAYGLTPSVALYDGNTNAIIEEFSSINLDHSDLEPLVKQVLLGKNNVLLVAVRNNGNLSDYGSLYVKIGNHTIETVKEGAVIQRVNTVTAGSISYYEIVLKDTLAVDENTIITVYIETDGGTEKGSCSENNILYITLKEYDRSVSEDGSSYIPTLRNDIVKYDPQNPDDAEISYSCGAEDELITVVLGDTLLTNGEQYRVTEGEILKRLILSNHYLLTLPGGNHTLKLYFKSGYETEVTLTVVKYYTVTWLGENAEALKDCPDVVAEGTIPSFGMEAPGKDSTHKHTYTFVGWDVDGDGKADSMQAVTNDVVYTAVWQEVDRQYVVTWSFIDEVGQTVEVEEKYTYERIPAYLGTYFAPKGMIFSAWDKTIEPVTKNVTYMALYEQDITGSAIITNTEFVSLSVLEFETTVKLSQIENMETAVITLNYNQQAVTLISYSCKENVRIVETENGSLTLSVSDINGEIERELITFKFEVNQEIAEGEYKILEAVSENTLEEVFDAIVINKPGDLNGDDKVNMADVLLLRRYLSGGYNVSVNEIGADVNNDGKLNMADILLLRRYLAGGYGVELK